MTFFPHSNEYIENFKKKCLIISVIILIGFSSSRSYAITLNSKNLSGYIEITLDFDIKRTRLSIKPK